MKEYTLYADNRRPLKFSGELLGSSTVETVEEIQKKMQASSEDKERQKAMLDAGQSTASFSEIKLDLYRTASAKVILEITRVTATVNRVTGLNVPFFGVKASIKIYDSIQAYSDALGGKLGKPTAALISNILENHPDLQEYLVETID